MKGFGKFLFTFLVLTAALVLYVHERVEMFRVSYRIHDKSADLSARAESFRQLKYEVAQLRSPQSLEKKLEALSLGLTLPKEIQILRISTQAPQPHVEPIPLHPPTRNFFDFLGQWIQIAQARTDQ